MKKIKIAHLFYDLMNLYGENGNVRFLKKKLEDQDFEVEIHFLSLEDKIDYNKYDIYYIGTGSDENKELIIEDMVKQKDEIKDAIINKKFFLATGNALELFGNKIVKKDNNEIECLGVFNFTSVEEEFRIVGEQLYHCDLIDNNLVGFQNRDSIIKDSDDNLFKVIKGCGYSPDVNYEGIHNNNFYGTYLLGPILVRNPYFTDYIVKEICRSMDVKYKKPNLDDICYKAYHEYLKNFYENQ